MKMISAVCTFVMSTYLLAVLVGVNAINLNAFPGGFIRGLQGMGTALDWVLDNDRQNPILPDD